MPCAVLVVVPARIDRTRVSRTLCVAGCKCPILHGSAWRQSLTGAVPLQRNLTAQRFCLTRRRELHSGRVHGRHCVRCRAWRGPMAELGMALSRAYAASAEYCREAAQLAGRWTVPIAVGSLALVGIWQLVAFIRRAALPDNPTCSARG